MFNKAAYTPVLTTKLSAKFDYTLRKLQKNLLEKFAESNFSVLTFPPVVGKDQESVVNSVNNFDGLPLGGATRFGNTFSTTLATCHPAVPLSRLH